MVRLKVAKIQAPYKPTTTFQFQYGSIKRYQAVYHPAYDSYFNSNMVRLKEILLINTPIDIRKFQFQYGSIKSCICQHSLIGAIPISIPIWFD